MKKDKQDEKKTPGESIKKMELSRFIAYFRENVRPDKRFCFILGAGASKTSGIPTGAEMAREWLEHLQKRLSKKEYTEWVDTYKIDSSNPAANYPDIYDKRFEIDNEDGFFYLAKAMEKADPSCGYSVLAKILADTPHNVVITTNFDSMIEDAMFTYTQKKPLVCGHESLAGYVDLIINRPLVAKIHRDLLLAPKSSATDTSVLPESWSSALKKIFSVYTPLVIGYGGNDGSLMGFLEGLERIRGKIFWCYRQEGGLPDGRIRALVAKHKGFFIPIPGFDEMMIQLMEELGYKLLDKAIIDVAQAKAKKYIDQIDAIRKKAEAGRASDPATDAALTAIIKKSNSWWAVHQAAKKEPDIEKRDRIYQQGLCKFPNSAELYGTYAIFLTEIRKDYNHAEGLFKKELELDPDHAFSSGNYASFLHTIRKDYDNAEVLYKRALELDPDHAIITGNYALFLHKVRKDYDNAEVLYKKALELDPEHAILTGNYASFLLERGDRETGRSLLEWAFSLVGNDDSLKVRLLFNLYVYFYSEQGESAWRELRELLDHGVRSTESNFCGDIAAAEREGHPRLEMVRRLSQVINDQAPVSILDDEANLAGKGKKPAALEKRRK